MSIRRPVVTLTAVLVVILLSLAGCGKDPLIPASLGRDGNVKELLGLALDPGTRPGERFAALEPLIARYREVGAVDELTLLLWRV